LTFRLKERIIISRRIYMEFIKKFLTTPVGEHFPQWMFGVPEEKIREEEEREARIRAGAQEIQNRYYGYGAELAEQKRRMEQAQEMGMREAIARLTLEQQQELLRRLNALEAQQQQARTVSPPPTPPNPVYGGIPSKLDARIPMIVNGEAWICDGAGGRVRHLENRATKVYESGGRIIVNHIVNGKEVTSVYERQGNAGYEVKIQQHGY
jgi:hypothetical protein